jgi:hypothetical protein
MEITKLSENRYDALDEVRSLLGFKKSEWRSLLIALAKADNACFDFVLGDCTLRFEKFIEINELHMELKFVKGKLTKTFDYAYDLNEFIELMDRGQLVGLL